MRIINCEQGTEEWFEARAGIPTASMFSAMMAGGQGKTRRAYMLKLAGEKMTGEIAESFGNIHTERGHVMEPQARELYCLQTGYDVQDVGFIRADYDAGASPDSLVNDDGLLEIKSKLPHLQLEVLLSDKVPFAHLRQIYGQILIAEREWCDFVSYWPGLPLFVKRVYADDKICGEIRAEIDRFNNDLYEIIEKIESM